MRYWGNPGICSLIWSGQILYEFPVNFDSISFYFWRILDSSANQVELILNIFGFRLFSCASETRSRKYFYFVLETVLHFGCVYSCIWVWQAHAVYSVLTYRWDAPHESYLSIEMNKEPHCIIFSWFGITPNKWMEEAFNGPTAQAFQVYAGFSVHGTKKLRPQTMRIQYGGKRWRLLVITNGELNIKCTHTHA